MQPVSSDAVARPIAPPRPSIPPAAWMLTGVWAGVTLAEAVTWGSVHGAVAVLVVLACAVVATVPAARGMRLAAVGLACGVVVGWLFWTDVDVSAARISSMPAGRIEAQVLTDATMGATGARSIVAMHREGGRIARLEVAWPRDSASPAAGRSVTVYGSAGTRSRDEWARRRHQAGVAARVRARVVREHGWSRSLRGFVGPWRSRALAVSRTIPGSGAALVDGVVMGERSRLAGTTADEDFRTTGLTHLVAVSGGHLVVVAALVGWLLMRVGVRPSARFTVSAVVLGLYVVASGMQASAVRAWGMSLVVSAALAGARRADATAALCVAGCVAMLHHPPIAFDLGFRLSVAAVAGLIVFARLGEVWLSAGLPGFAQSLAGPVSLTLVAQAVTVPLIVTTFGVLSLVAPVANLLVGPVVSGVLLVGLAGSMTAGIAPGLSRLAFLVAAKIGDVGCAIAHHLAAIPGAAVPVTAVGPVLVLGCVGVAFMVWVVWPAPSIGVARAGVLMGLTGTIALGVGPPAPRGASIVMLDVGQGDAILVRDGGSTLLVDAGPPGPALRQALARQGVRRVDALLVTHLHDDHYGGVGSLGGAIRVDSLMVGAGAEDELPDDLARLDAPVTAVSAGDVVRCGDIELRVVWPPGPVDDPATNEASVVMEATAGDATVLLTGDAESDVLGPLAAGGRLHDVDVLKVGHHGSESAVDASILGVIRPEVAAVSVGAGNRYGHPHAATIAEVERHGCAVYRTDRLGDVVLAGTGR